jgi:transcriptional regulator with XRE-family HTH domain
LEGGKKVEKIEQVGLLDIICSMTTGQKIRMVRDFRKWNQSELAERARVDKQSIWHWENGKRNPEPRSLRDVAKALGVKEEDLL